MSAHQTLRLGLALGLGLLAHAAGPLDSCQAAADAWCNSPASGDGTRPCAALAQGRSCSPAERYVARLGRGSPAKGQLRLAWRCYAESVAANASNTNYATECYCTRPELVGQLTQCQQRAAPAALVFSSIHPPAAPAGTPRYTMVRIPALLATPSGTLMAFATARRGTGGDYAWNDLLLRRSSDNGASWGAVQYIPGDDASKPTTVDNACPIYDRWMNRTVLVYMSDGKKMLVSTSDDEGEHWTDPRDISNGTIPPDDPEYSLVYTGPPGGIQTSTGRLVCPSHHAKANNAGAGGTDASYAVYSDDFGQTWHRGGDVTKPGFSGENQLAELPGGALLTSIRVNGAWDNSYHLNRTHLFALSRDQANSWEPAFAAEPDFPEVNCEGSMVGYTRAGQHRLLYSGILGGGIGAVGNEPRTGMVLRQSSDGGRSWPQTTTVWAGLADYSSLAVLQDGAIGLLYTRNASAGETVFSVLPGI